MDKGPPLEVKVWGEFACFTRPEFGVERVSYEVMTPSATRDILEAIFWKPEFRWLVREISVLKPVRHFSILRNEMNSTQSDRSARSWEANGGGYYADDDRAQRHTLCLRDVAYIIRADMELEPHSKDNPAKYRDQFRRRVKRGQCFNQPYLGTREFSAFFGPPDGDEEAIDVSDDLGLMLFDVDFVPDARSKISHLGHGANGREVIRANAQPRFFQARLEKGVLRVPQEMYERGAGVILRRLVEYAERREAEKKLTPPNYGSFRVNWTISLSSSGDLEGFIPASDKKGFEVIVPRYSVKRTSGIKADLLADEGEYVLGIPRDPGRSVQVKKQHAAFMELTRRCAEKTGDSSVKAILTFLEDWIEGKYEDRLPAELQPRDKMTFRVGGTFPAQDSEKVREFWVEEQTPDVDRSKMMCLVTGEIGPVAQRLPHNIGVPDKKGTRSTAAMVSAQNDAFMSYGLENSLTSPISHASGERFAKALNSLISSEKSRLYMGSFVYLFWTREKTEFDVVSLLDEPTPEMVHNLFSSPYRSQPSSKVEANDFYALSLSRSKARVAVRDYIETKVATVAENLDRWFADQQIINPAGEFDGYFGVKALARASVYRGQETSADADLRVQPAFVASLIHAALEDGPVDGNSLAALVQRIRKGVARKDGTREHVTHSLAACTKLALLRERRVRMFDVPEQLNPDQEKPAYHCGRLLAELEALQKAAIPGVKATVVDRYYGAASSTPASVFGTLMRNHTAHIGKVRKERPGVGAAIQDRIGEITQKIGPEFPRNLNMREQAVFALGYYHQRANNRAEAKATREARERS